MSDDALQGLVRQMMSAANRATGSIPRDLVVGATVLDDATMTNEAAQRLLQRLHLRTLAVDGSNGKAAKVFSRGGVHRWGGRRLRKKRRERVAENRSDREFMIRSGHMRRARTVRGVDKYGNPVSYRFPAHPKMHYNEIRA